MVNISGMSEIANGSASSNYCLASVVSNNFSQILTAVNSSRLNSDNYGISAVMSQNISTGEMKSSHISNYNVYSSHFSAVTFLESHVNYRSSDGGARLLRIGPTFSSVPANGIVVEQYSTVVTLTSGAITETVIWSLVMSKGVSTRPAFSTTPWIIGEPYMQVSVTDTRYGYGNKYAQVKNLGSMSCTVEFVETVSQTATRLATLNIDFMGAARA